MELPPMATSCGCSRMAGREAARRRPGRIRRRALLLTSLLTVVATACTTVSAGGGPSTNSGIPRGGVLRVAMPAWNGSWLGQPTPTAGVLDPQFGQGADAAELFRCCLLRTLYSSTGRPARDGGAELYPDLAVGRPEVSADGLTWTFRIRRGITYAPPMQRTEITAADFIRAFQREARIPTGRDRAGYPIKDRFYSVIEGFDQYRDQKSSTISGLETPDRYTLKVHLNQLAGDLTYRFTLSNSAPIPPSPIDPSAPDGVATGHDAGYGRFLVASGPYMIKGSPQLNFAASPDRQRPVSGFLPGTSLTLVRNPSWSAATDPLRPAYLDEIQLRFGMSRDDAARQWESRQADLIWLSSPPPQLQPWLVQKVQSNHGLGQLKINSRDTVRYISMNLAVPPFDDIHVRKAVNYVINKRALLDTQGEFAGMIATHIAPDSLENDALAEFDPYATPDHRGSLERAREEMKQSRYDLDHSGTCSAPACKQILALIINSVALAGTPMYFQVADIIAGNLSQIGITLNVQAPTGVVVKAGDPTARVPLVLTLGSGKSYLSASSVLVPLFATGPATGDTRTSGCSPTCPHTLVGATPEQLSGWGYSISSVPSVDDRIHECARGGEHQIQCWAELDVYVMQKVVPIAPYTEESVVQVVPPRVVNYSFDQFASSPALDQIAVRPG
jgi:ABC-type transport system substrate-binding protein